MERVPSPLKDIRSLFKLIFLIHTLKPQIVHSHTPKAGLLGMLAAYICRVPVRLHTVAGIPWMESTGIKKFFLRHLEKLTYFSSTHVYSNSFTLKKFILSEKLLPNRKISVIANGSSNGIDTTKFQRTKEVLQKAEILKQKLGLTNEKVIIFVGRLVKEKGIEELLHAFIELEKHHNVKLLLVGPYEKQRDPIGAWAEELIKNSQNILSTGFVKDVKPYFAISDILAFPSYREGFPNVPMQAGAMGLPAVVTNINGCNEIISSGVNGLIVSPKSSSELHDALNDLLTNDAFYDKLAKQSRIFICKKFDQKELWLKLKDEYYNHLKETGVSV
jgi:glycosyltransferase involved in cell wall biosynthesis